MWLINVTVTVAAVTFLAWSALRTWRGRDGSEPWGATIAAASRWWPAVTVVAVLATNTPAGSPAWVPAVTVTCAATVAVATALAVVAAKVINPRRRVSPWWAAIGWITAAIGCAWLAGFPSVAAGQAAHYPNPVNPADAVVHGAWAGLVVSALGAAHIRQLILARRNERRRTSPTAPTKKR